MRTPAILLTLSAASLLAQTSKPPVHHTTTATHHAVVHHSTCKFPAPELSPKIPALPPTADKCPTAEYSLTYIETKIGTGELAEPHKWYTVRYTGYLPDGTIFDSTDKHPGAEPITFPYGAHRVIAGWDTGFDGMHVGGKRRIFIPYQLAYGELGRPPVIPPKTPLIFDVELVSQSSTPPAPPRPPVRPVPPTTPKPAAPGTATPPAAAAPASTPPGAAAPPPVTSSTPAATTQPSQPTSTTEPKK